MPASGSVSGGRPADRRSAGARYFEGLALSR
jgi:hypothetical protein